MEEKKKAGRPAGTKYIETPEKMWELFTAYRDHVKSNPRLQHDFVGKLSEPVFRKKEVPLTMEGFENYVSELGIISDLGHYFANTDGRYEDYCTICTRIRRVIRQDQIEGGMVGIYNASITARLTGLADRSEQRVIQEQPIFGDVDEE